MGVISITRRRETLGNIGGTSMAHGVTDTDAGSSRSGAYARTFSPHYYAKHEWAGDDGIAKGIGDFAAVAAGISIREDERESDELVRKTIDQLDRIDRDERVFTSDELGEDSQYRYLLGDADADGNYVNAQKRGLRLRTGAGTRRLVEETDQTFADTFTKVAEELGASDKAKTNARKRLFSYQQGRVKYAFDTQASEYRRMELQGAKDQLTAFTSAYLSGNEDVLGDVFEAREKLGILEGKTDEQRRLDATTLAQGIATAAFENWEAEAANSADPDAVKAAWDERRKAFVTEDGKKPEDPLLATAYDNGLDKDGEKKVLAAFDKCAKRSVATARYNKVRQDEQVRDGLVAKEAALFGDADGQVRIPNPENPEEVKADMATKAIKYGDLANEAEAAGNYQLALAYRKTSQTLQKGLYGYMSDLDKAQRAARYNKTQASFLFGCYEDENGERHELTAWDRQRIAREQYNSGEIDYPQYVKLLSMVAPEVDERFGRMRNRVLDYAKKLVPNALVYNSKTEKFSVRPSKDVRESTKTGVKWNVYDGKEEATYADFATAMNDAMTWMRTNNKSDEEGWEYFLKLTDGDARDASQRNIVEKLNFERQVNDDYMKARKVNAK